jgi:transposase-like protein
MKCPRCGREEKQHKIGKTKAGSQRYRCYVCHGSYTPARKAAGYDPGLRQKAIQLYVDGMNLRRIGRQLGINPQTIANWVKRYAEKLPAAPVPARVQKAEMDELFTFIGNKKTGSTS